jgi:myo-inositol 2-dehydrogenase / D-chiro-inositol 1-dehydrogenase
MHDAQEVAHESESPTPDSPSPAAPAPPSLRVGILGAGRRGKALAHAATRLPGVTVAAVGDEDAARAAELAERWEATSYSIWQSMLIFERLDAIFIATPAAVQAEQVLTALDQGMHVYVEKPSALDLAMAQRIAEAALSRDRLVHVGFQHRYSSLVAPWYQALEGRAVSLVHAHLYQGAPDDADVGDPASTGGQAVAQAMHLLDLCRFLVDDITAVAAFGGRALWRDRTEWKGTDSTAVSLQFASGASGTLSLTYAMPLPIPGHLALDVVADGPLLLRFTGAALQVVTEGGVEDWTLEGPPDFAAVAAFLEAVRTGDRSQLRVPYDDAVRTLRVALACRDAAESGTVVRL